MARDDFWDDDWFGGDDFTYDKPELNDLLFGNSLEVDQRAQDLFADAFFNKDERAHVELVEYLKDEYDIDFEDEFDWEEYRALESD